LRQSDTTMSAFIDSPVPQFLQLIPAVTPVGIGYGHFALCLPLLDLISDLRVQYSDDPVPGPL
jgi:hypothetical protein